MTNRQILDQIEKLNTILRLRQMLDELETAKASLTDLQLLQTHGEAARLEMVSLLKRVSRRR